VSVRRRGILVLSLLLAGCATARPYDAPLTGPETWVVKSPGGYGVTPLMKSIEWRWQHATATSDMFALEHAQCEAESRTSLGATMFGGRPPVQRYEDCMEKRGYRLIGKLGGGEPVERGWGRGFD
jgi:hypothetical protein